MIASEGKIIDVYFGTGGRNNQQIGFTITFDTYDGICSQFIGWWNTDVDVNEGERNRMYADVIKTMDGLLKTANVSRINHLVNIPVKCVVEGSVVKEFSIIKLY